MKNAKKSFAFLMIILCCISFSPTLITYCDQDLDSDTLSNSYYIEGLTKAAKSKYSVEYNKELSVIEDEFRRSANPFEYQEKINKLNQKYRDLYETQNSQDAQALKNQSKAKADSYINDYNYDRDYESSKYGKSVSTITKTVRQYAVGFIAFAAVATAIIFMTASINPDAKNMGKIALTGIVVGTFVLVLSDGIGKVMFSILQKSPTQLNEYLSEMSSDPDKKRTGEAVGIKNDIIKNTGNVNDNNEFYVSTQSPYEENFTAEEIVFASVSGVDLKENKIDENHSYDSQHLIIKTTSVSGDGEKNEFNKIVGTLANMGTWNNFWIENPSKDIKKEFNEGTIFYKVNGNGIIPNGFIAVDDWLRGYYFSCDDKDVMDGQVFLDSSKIIIKPKKGSEYIECNAKKKNGSHSFDKILDADIILRYSNKLYKLKSSGNFDELNPDVPYSGAYPSENLVASKKFDKDGFNYLYIRNGQKTTIPVPGTIFNMGEGKGEIGTDDYVLKKVGQYSIDNKNSTYKLEIEKAGDFSTGTLIFTNWLTAKFISSDNSFTILPDLIEITPKIFISNYLAPEKSYIKELEIKINYNSKTYILNDKTQWVEVK